jgi:hypothetical protein
LSSTLLTIQMMTMCLLFLPHLLLQVLSMEIWYNVKPGLHSKKTRPRLAYIFSMACTLLKFWIVFRKCICVLSKSIASWCSSSSQSLLAHIPSFSLDGLFKFYSVIHCLWKTSQASQCRSEICNIDFDIFKVVPVQVLLQEFDGEILFELPPANVTSSMIE